MSQLVLRFYQKKHVHKHKHTNKQKIKQYYHTHTQYVNTQYIHTPINTYYEQKLCIAAFKEKSKTYKY